MPYAKKSDKNTARKQREYVKSESDKNTARKEREYVKFDALDRVVELEEADMWLQNGMYAAPGVSIAIDDEHTLGGWTRKIKLRNVCLDVVENERGFLELVISGVASDVPF